MVVATVQSEETKKTHMHFPFLFISISALICALLHLRDLEWEDRVSVRKGGLLFLYGCIFFVTLYHALNNILLKTVYGQKFTKKYKLTMADIYDISNKVVSAVQAVFCCVSGAISTTYSCFRDVLKTSHYACEAYAWFGSAYFLYDIWSMYKVYTATCINQSLLIQSEQKKINHHHHSSNSNSISQSQREYSWLYVAQFLRNHFVIVGHHLFIGIFGFLVMTYLRGNQGDCFYGFIYLMEASTPLVSLRGILSKMGLKNTNLYVMNGLVMLVVFFICRVAMFPCVIYLYAQAVDLDYISAVRSLPRGCKISILILLLPQFYWFLLMLRGASNVLKNKSSTTTNNSSSNTHSKRRSFKNSH